MRNEFTLIALRDMENQRQNLPPDCPMAVESHARRGAALHDIFDDDPNFEVLDWGVTDDKTRTHETAQILFDFGQSVIAAGSHLAQPALIWLGAKLAEAAMGVSMEAGVKYLIGKVWPKVKSGQIENAWLRLPDKAGTTVTVNADQGGTILFGNRVGLLATFRMVEAGPSPTPPDPQHVG